MKVAPGTVIVALLVCGCGKTEDAPVVFKKGAMVRAVNLTPSRVDVTFGPVSTSCEAWERSIFLRTPPKQMDVTFKGASIDSKVPIKLEGDTRYTFYIFENGGKVETATVKGDPKDAGTDKVAFRAISFTDGVDVIIKPTSGESLEAKSLKTGEAGSELISSPQTFTVTATKAGKAIGEATVEAQGNESYTIAVTGGAKPELKVYVNNPKMKASPAGASPA